MAWESGRRSFGALRLVASATNEAGRAAEAVRDDQALLAAIRSGEATVAAELCDRLAPQVERTIHRLLGRNDSDREDLAQISLMEIVNTIGRYRADCSLDRWAQIVTGHVVFKHLRRRSLERRLFSDLIAEDVHAGPIQLERVSASKQMLRQIAAHLDTMNPARVWAFLMHDVMGYSLDEIAEMTGASLAAAQSRLSRGRRELHDLVAQDPGLADLLQKVIHSDSNAKGDGHFGAGEKR